ncbi:alpha/beta fold hydrolase [Azospirillum sp.]|uniref:alpha/beta fold hydrolase n=1 Tax=Azospirillum sp. TaxID=34012 RepID=UPI002D41655B|nr:alpha/beta fold hydrolase [Azospirillum sp.]HYD70515.1 alpha/beta fold hydrolase [Azospirillum sp.]
MSAEHLTLRLRRHKLDLAGGPAGWLALGDGAGVPAVLVHGFAGDLTSWQFNMTALSHRRRVIAIDLPGHGVSTPDVAGGDVRAFAPWLVRVLDALGLERVHLVGHSMGGRVALELAIQAPERAASLSLLAPAGIYAGFDLAFLRRLLAVREPQEAEACVARLFARPTPYAAVLARGLVARLTVPGFREPLAAILEASFAAPPPGPDLDRLACPLQLIWGAEDTVIPVPPPECRPALAPFHLLQSVGHLPHLEAASRVNGLLGTFFAQAGEG